MNYLKMNSFNQNCLADTTIQITEEIINIKNKNIPPKELQSHTSFANNYFTLLISQENAIDIITPIISNFPNSNLSLFLSLILVKHIINLKPHHPHMYRNKTVIVFVSPNEFINLF